jgi:lipopolysaccharide/colanic/teichoic acid biosynthesis glycosyltransferase
LERQRDLVAAAALIVLMAPLMAFVALAIKCSSRGSVLVREERGGAYGRFTSLKFRTTEIRHVEAGGRPHPESDLTGVGWFIRYTRIENLPQLLNVLRGEMSCFLGSRRPFFLD